MAAGIDESDASQPGVTEAPAATFDEAARGRLHHGEHVLGVKPSTLRNHRHQLIDVGPARATEFGGPPLGTITTAQIKRLRGGPID